MAFSSSAALWFLPFVLPLCLYVAYTDLALMKITNKAVVTLGAIYVILGLFVLPSFEAYLWGFAQFAIVLGVGFVLNAIGAMGAGDAKFIAFAAPFIAPGDLPRVVLLFTCILLAALLTHRGARASRLRDLAPDWVSWSQGKRFPLGLALGPTLALYLCLSALNGA
ncbi:prepilin peptidase [Roseobacter litoralis]|uniref:prepilin peptidase n=1 Tax=Roseobacter litoralis TaxID=42443 RepID=UPI002490E2FE|nr:prepilin peptidase [Roseobacter litoralis]